MEEDYILTPPDMKEAAKKVQNDLLPQRSREKYLSAYENFQKWLREHKAPISEDVLLFYFTELASRMKPNSLWSYFSRLKTTIQIKKNIDISKYISVTTYIKRLNAEYVPIKQATVLSEEEVNTFILCAPDEVFLAIKVALIFGVMGALRMVELHDLKIKDIEWHGDKLLLVKISAAISKNKKKRSFTIQDDYLELVRRYIALRPENLTKTDKFFIQYNNGKCTCQCIGINTLRGYPKVVAEYLNLPNAKGYTGHTFRRTSTTILANAGASTSTIKRHTGHKSSTVVDRYIEDSLLNKKKTAEMIRSAVANSVPNQFCVNERSIDNDQPSGSTFKSVPADNVFTEKTELSKSTPVPLIYLDYESQVELGSSQCNNDNDYYVISSQSELIQYQMIDLPNTDNVVNDTDSVVNNNNVLSNTNDVANNTDNVVNKDKPKFKFVPKTPMFYKFYNCTVNINNN